MTALTVVTDQYQQDVARAQAVADRIKGITGCQCGEDPCWRAYEVTCWRCHADLSIRDARPDGGQDWTCTNFSACDERAAMQADEERNERVFGGAHA